jgi:hypothetical protein
MSGCIHLSEEPSFKLAKADVPPASSIACKRAPARAPHPKFEFDDAAAAKPLHVRWNETIEASSCQSKSNCRAVFGASSLPASRATRLRLMSIPVTLHLWYLPPDCHAGVTLQA